MSEQILAQVPSIFRWKGPKQGRTMLTAQVGRLTLTSDRLIFEPARGEALVIPLAMVTGAELTGKVIKNLTVGYQAASGTEYSTFATQQFGMPQAQQWVDQITSGSAAARGERAPWPDAAPPAPPAPPSPPAPPVPPAAAAPPNPPAPQAAHAGGNGAVSASSYEPYVRFIQTEGTVPQLLSWRVLRTLEPEVVEPATGRVEIWGDVVAPGPVQYLHIAAGYRPDGTLRVIAGAETMPAFHDDCYLGVFLDGVHQNLGAHEECRDLDGFVERGVDLVLGVLDGERAAAAAPPQPAPVPPPPAPVPPQPTSPPPAPAPPPPPPVLEPDVVPRTRDEAVALLRELDAQARQDPPSTHVAVGTYLRRSAAACEVMDREPAAAILLDAAQAADDPVWLAAAGNALLDAGFAPLATVPLAASLRLGNREPATVEMLAVAHDFADDLHGAAQVLRDHAWAREASESVRAFWTHVAAMTGDLPEVRRTVAQLVPDGPFESYRRQALDRLARAEALGPPEGDPEQPEAALRWWDAVLQGAVLVHVSPYGAEDMGGRYAALFDDVDRFGQVLAGLDAALTEAGHGRPARVVAAPDRDSQILGWALCTRYGLEAPERLDDPEVLEADAPGVTLIAAYTWTGVLDEDAGARFRDDPTSVLFAYSLEWTRMHRLVPDVVGVEAQTIVPPWGERMRVNGMPGVDLPEGARPEVVTIPADDREPALVGRDFAAQAAQGTPDEATARAAATVVERLRDAGAPAGILGGARALWYPGGPFRSAHF